VPETRRRVERLRLYTPHPKQLECHRAADISRFLVIAFGRQSGKSTWANNHILRRAWERPGVYWYLASRYDSAETQYRRAKHALTRSGAITRHHDTKLELCLRSGSAIRYQSGKVLHDLRGDTLHGVVVDEMRQQHRDLWSQVLNPMLATTGGWAAIVSTPNGYDHFYDLAQRARTGEEGWAYFNAPSTCNPRFTQAEFDRSRREMSQAEFRQEILAEFVNLTQGSAYTFTQDLITDRHPFNIYGGDVHPHLAVHLYCDFNVRPLSWVIAQYHPVFGHYCLDEIFLTQRTNTEEGAREFVERYRRLGTTASVRIVGDATGKSLKTSASGETDYSILFQVLRDAGIAHENLTPDANPGVKDRVNAVNARLKPADGKPRIRIHPRCKNLIRDLERVVWKEGASAILDQKTDPLLTHLSDALGYGVMVFDPIQGVAEVGSLRVLSR